MAEGIGHMGNAAPAVGLGWIVLRGTCGESRGDSRVEVRDDEIQMHWGPVARVAPEVRAGLASGRAGRLDQQVQRRRRTDQLDACGAEAPADRQLQQRGVEGDGTVQIINVDVDQQ